MTVAISPVKKAIIAIPIIQTKNIGDFIFIKKPLQSQLKAEPI